MPFGLGLGNSATDDLGLRGLGVVGGVRDPIEGVLELHDTHVGG